MEKCIGLAPSQKFKVLFDTGNCEFWVPSFNSNDIKCYTYNRYVKSKTFEPFHNEHLDIRYLSGYVSGTMIKDTVTIGDNDIQIKHQLIGLAEEIDIPLMNEVTWDAVLGLAYSNKNLKSKGITPIMDNIINQKLLHSKGEKKQFSYYLSMNNGAITFGVC